MLSKKRKALQDFTFMMQNPAEPFFKTPPPPPPTHTLDVRYCLVRQKNKAGLFRRGFQISEIPSDANAALLDPFKDGFSCLMPRRWSRPTGCQAPRDLPARCRAAFPHLEGTDTATRCEAPPPGLVKQPPPLYPASPTGSADGGPRGRTPGPSHPEAAAGPLPLAPLLLGVL